MKHKLFGLCILFVLLFSLATPIPAQAGSTPPPPDFATLQPGQFRTIDQALDINVVFIGFEDQEVDLTALESQLPETYKTLIRYPDFYGIREFMGNDFTFDYNFLTPTIDEEDGFFTWLADVGYKGPLTLFQDYYNQNLFRQETITDEVLYVDGPTVEAWLEANLDYLLGDYTVFFINWYGRSDFQFHVYTKTDYPDPDTGYNFGEERASRKMIAWGGSTGRTWFYDFSAGPESWANNWIIDPPDPGMYTIPPIWEYGNTQSYRPFDDLTGDLAKIVRYIGIDLLFTPSPLYKPLLSPPLLPNTINIDLNLFEGDPYSSGMDVLNTDFVEAQYDYFQPYKDFTVDLNDYSLDARLSTVFDCWGANLDSCFGNRLFNIAFGDLFLYFEDHILQYINGNADYEIPIFLFNTTAEKMGGNLGLLGYADDNWRDGTQSFIFAFGTQYYRELGYGLTGTAVHETGHHIGLSHPHDGYDYETNVDFGPDGAYQFVWDGDESDTVMHYMDLSPAFGLFNQDAMYRYETAGYINEANAILAKILASPRAPRVYKLLGQADNAAGQALSSYEAMNYLEAVTNAKAAYDQVVTAAAMIKVPIEPESWQADYKARNASFTIDPIRYPDQ